MTDQPRIKPEIITALREWAEFEQDGGNVEQGAAIDIILDWYDRQIAALSAASAVRSEPSDDIVRELIEWPGDGQELREQAATLITSLREALALAAPYVELAVQDDGGIDNCEIGDRLALERIRTALNPSRKETI